MPALLNDAEIERSLQSIPGWRFENGALRRDFVFSDFRAAFAFMTRIALAAERADHHPEWSNVYNRVALAWSTHSAGGVTQRDVEMAGLSSDAAG